VSDFRKYARSRDRVSPLLQRLDETLDRIEDPQKLVGRAIPIAAIEWAEQHGLEVQRAEFAPPGRLYIIGAVPVPWADTPGKGESK
jgi:hypothetical protein